MRTSLYILIIISGTVALCVSFLSTYIFRESLSWTVWRSFHSAPLATALNRTDPILLFDIGNYYFSETQYDIKKAEEFFKRAISLNNYIPSTHYQLARVYFLKGDFYEALAEVNKEIELSPYFYKSYYVRGLVYGYNGDLDKSIVDFEKFLTFNPESWAAHNDLAWVYFRKGEYEHAAATAREGLRYSPHNPWLLNALGVALLNEGDFAEAKDALEAALTATDSMTPADWGESYPGNNPSIYNDGLAAMKMSIKRNLELIAVKSG